MKYLYLPFFLIVFLYPHLVLANPPEAYITPDGPTSPIASETGDASPPPAPEAVTTEQSEDGKVEYNIVASKPPCSTSTCITNQSVANAKNVFVQNSPVKSYVDLINLPQKEGEEEATCKEPVKTGMTVYRQVVASGTAGQIVEVEDAFCINQGCVYFGGIGEEKCQL